MTKSGHKRLAFYQLLAGEEWPAELREEFGRHFSRFGVPSFAVDSEADQRFRASVERRRIPALRDTILACTGEHVYEHPFHYLSVRSDRSYDKGDFLDLSAACPGDSRVRCRIGARQTGKLVMDAGKSKDLDLIEESSSPRPKVFIVSRRLRDSLRQADFRGFRLVPTLRRGATYSDQQRELSYVDDRLVEEAPFFQLLVTARAPGAPWVGEVVRTFYQCSRCGTLNGAFFESGPRFKPEDLDQDADIQTLSRYRTSNQGQVEIMGEVVVISARFLRFLKDNKVRGLARYSSDPPAKHGIVDLLD
ncbi:MAG: hypothetical protein GY719_24070 [bacterium]|nr:hypothetical protein [bacterium]